MMFEPYALMVFSTFFSSLGALFAKKASKSLGFDIFEFIFDYNLLLSCSLYLFAILLTVLAYRNGSFSSLIPIISLNYVWISLLSVKYLNEDLNNWRLSGILLIIIGLVVTGV